MNKEEIILNIKGLQEFLEEDLYTKLRPETKIDGKIWVREDTFKNEKQFRLYLSDHFELLINKLNNTLGVQDESNN